MNTRIVAPRRWLAVLALFIFTACGGGGGGPGTRPLDLDLNLDYRRLDSAQRRALTGLDDAQRAALNLWETQMLAAGLNDGGIYFNVLNNPANFSPAEVALVRGWYNDEMAEHGGVNGKSLDQHFFDAALLITDESLASRYSDSPAVYATGPIDPNTVVTGDNGLSSFDNAVIRLWVHDLFDNGAMDGSITKFTLLSPYALDAVDGTPGSLDPADVRALLAADLAVGAPDGTPLRLAFSDALDAVYFNEGGASIAKLFSTVGIDQVEADALFADWAKRRGYSQSAALRLVLAEAAIE